MVRRGIVAPGPAGPAQFEALLLYPFLALLTGLAFFTMGSSYWGRYYAIGVGFLLLAVLMPFWMQGAPLLLGGAWAACLVAVALHLRRLENEARAPSESQPLAASQRGC